MIKTGLSLWHQSLLSSLLAILSSVIQNEERANKSPAFLLEEDVHTQKIRYNNETVSMCKRR